MRFVPSRHSSCSSAARCRWTAKLTCDHLDGLVPGRLPLRRGLGHPDRGRRGHLYHQGSADLDDAELRDEPVDVFLAGVAGRSFTPRYWERILPRLDPRVVVPTHYDDFFAPLGRQAGFLRRAVSPRFPARSRRCRATPRVAALPRIDA